MIHFGVTSQLIEQLHLTSIELNFSVILMD